VSAACNRHTEQQNNRHAMSSSDEYGAEGDDTEFLAAATQVEATQNALQSAVVSAGCRK
jgi:hypothetical protein